MKYILCECGKRYREDNKKHFETIHHKKYIQDKKINESNETHIIVHDIDKIKLMEFLKSNASKKRRYAISDDEIKDLDYQSESSESSESYNSEEGDNEEIE